PKGSVFYAKSGVVRNLHQICISTRKVLPNTADYGLDITFVNTQGSTEDYVYMYTYVTANVATGSHGKHGSAIAISPLFKVNDMLQM
ncbi:hypothetical protein N7516_004482, partial [Penicillium verrucosum]|uniref:uncharacterized protein n=1 Tax=Penicillium verrucosum TaxID=60171 RepID=UPI0025451FBE